MRPMRPTFPLCEELPLSGYGTKTREALLEEMRQAIEFHLESLREHGEPYPKSAVYGRGD